MADLPTGTVTFLLTDVAGSTVLWEQQPAAMRAAVARHDAIIEVAVAKQGGVVVRPRGEGDSRSAVFARASDAAAAALIIQRDLTAEPWPTSMPLRVRLALHTGEADLREGDDDGGAVKNCARLRAVAHGGQVVLSQATADLVRDALPPDAGLRDLGEHRLRDLVQPEHVYQLLHPALPADFPPLRSLGAYPHNLPLQLTSFVGREHELTDVGRLLTGARLLTLTGTGGCGKTRLALTLAAQVVEDYPDGVWLVELAPLADPDLVPQAMAVVLGVSEQPGQALTTTLTEALRPRRLLLVLDNCEHVVDACAELVETLLTGCPGLTVLATSRELLGVSGETAWRVPSLAMPDPRYLPSGADLLDYAAIRLFVERARLVQPAFTLSEHNAAAVAAICHRLDGIPLAIELAAALARVLAPAEIAERLDDQFEVLAGGSRATPPRHRTLRATLDWSYDLLIEPERRLLRRLAVFAGGWTLSAAEAIGGDEDDLAGTVLARLTRLVDASLVIMDEDPTGVARFRLLETVRQYALERLAVSGESCDVSERHAAHYLALAEATEPRLEEGDLKRWLDRLELEHANLRAALRWLRERGENERGLRLATAMRLFWHLRGHLTEGRAWYAEFLAADRDVSLVVRARALDAAGFLARFQGDYAMARVLIEDGLAIRQQLGDRQAIVDALSNLGAVRLFQGDHAAARVLYEESLAANRAVGNRQGIADGLSHLGLIALYQDDLITAQALHDESLALWRDLGDGQGIGWALHKLGEVALARGAYDVARARFAESLVVRRDVGHRWGIAESLQGLGALAAARGQAERAVTLAGAAAAMEETVGIAPAPVRRERVDQWLRLARQALHEWAAAAAWQAGRTMAPEAAIAWALDESGSVIAPTHRPAATVTRREREVAGHLARGLTNRQIADALAISERTVERHVENMLMKLDFTSRTQVAVWATTHGLLDDQPP